MKYEIEFQINGVGSVDVDANSEREALEQFSEVDMKELAGECYFSSADKPTGIHIIRINDERYQKELYHVKQELDGKE